MKTLITILTSLLATTPLLFGIVALPPVAAGTNILALQAGQIREVSRRSFDSGRLDEIQHRMDILEEETFFLAVAVGAAGAAFVLTIRNLGGASRVRKDHAEASNTSK